MLKKISKKFSVVTWLPVFGYFLLVLIFWAGIVVSNSEKVFTLSALLLTLSFAIAFTWIFFKKTINPLDEISKVTKEMAQGNLDREIRIYSNGDIGDLARNINILGQRLKQKINEITEEKNRMRAVLNSMADGVVAVDSDGLILLVNPAVERALKISGESVKGKDIMGVIRQFDFEKNLKNALDTQEELTREIQILTPDPTYYRVVFTPLKGTYRGGVVAVMRDITEKQLLDQMRTEFIANVSHELRTPLTSIKGFLETLLEGALDERKTAIRFLKIINSETEWMTRLIEDLFSLSNIKTGKVTAAREEVDINKAVRKVIDFFSQAAGDRGIELVSKLPKDFPVITGDGDMLTRVFINLVDNAIKYSFDKGAIVIEGDLHGENEVFVSVSDIGVGIPEESITRIFERLYRVDKARTREYGGSGLGLSIVKQIVSIHNGRIDVSSKPGKGSKFTVYLPVK